jgi:hypothetical protein
LAKLLSIAKDGRTATVRKQIIVPRGAEAWVPAPRIDGALVKAVVRAHRWRDLLETGE